MQKLSVCFIKYYEKNCYSYLKIIYLIDKNCIDFNRYLFLNFIFILKIFKNLISPIIIKTEYMNEV